MRHYSNLFIIKADKDLFISTGKIATRTLETITNSVHILQPRDLNPITSTSNQDNNIVNQLNTFKILNPNYNVNFIIRYPWHRFTSGLFEIVGKSLMYIFSQQLKKYYKNDVLKIIPMFYDSDMWLNVINGTLAPIPKFEKDQIVSSSWLEFHLENWLKDVEYIVDNTQSNIIDLDDLSLYLNQNQYTFHYMNRSVNIIVDALSKEEKPIPTEWELREKILKSIDTVKMIGAFRKAVSLCNRSNEFLEYISEENEIYKRLIARKIVVGSNNNLKVF